LAPVVLTIALAGCEWFDRGANPRMIGATAPDFTLTDSDHTVALRDYRGKIIVLNFWTTWCPPCIEELPSLMQMQKRLAPRVVVLAVNTDESERAYKQFLVRHNVDLLTVRDAEAGSARLDNKTGGSAKLYGTTGQPETFIIDASGIVRRKFIGPVDWTSREITDYLNKL
jgi:cytochrome c biogenesis protein CcmG, thiol:disulfide interchange protein DsbE